MLTQSVQAALDTLRSERARIDGAIASLEGLVAGGANRPRKVGRPRAVKSEAPAASATSAAAGKKSRKNAPRGMLKKYIHEALKKAGKPLAPIDLTKAVLRAGYPNRNTKSLYTAIFAVAKKDTGLKKTTDGWGLK